MADFVDFWAAGPNEAARVMDSLESKSMNNSCCVSDLDLFITLCQIGRFESLL